MTALKLCLPAHSMVSFEPVNGTHTGRVEDLQRLMVAELIGSPVAVRILRAGRPLELELVPAELE